MFRPKPVGITLLKLTLEIFCEIRFCWLLASKFRKELCNDNRVRVQCWVSAEQGSQNLFIALYMCAHAWKNLICTLTIHFKKEYWLKHIFYRLNTLFPALKNHYTTHSTVNNFITLLPRCFKWLVTIFRETLTDHMGHKSALLCRLHDTFIIG
jgi:hypothetical protein